MKLFRDENEEEEELIESLLNPDDNILRFYPPELVEEQPIHGLTNDIWMLGCFFIEIFSKYKCWTGFSENEIIKHLRNSSIPKIPSDIPHILWGLICECISPFYHARCDIKEILIRYFQLMSKVGAHDVINRLCSNN